MFTLYAGPQFPEALKIGCSLRTWHHRLPTRRHEHTLSKDNADLTLKLRAGISGEKPLIQVSHHYPLALFSERFSDCLPVNPP